MADEGAYYPHENTALFGKLKISEISTKEIITWQNEMLAYRDEKKNRTHRLI